MELDDISSAGHGERTQHFLHQLTGKTGTSPDLTMQEVDLAWRLATEEMLNEVHTMLRHLTGVRG